MTNKEIQNITLESLRDWFKKEKWVRISSSGNIAGPCGTSKNKKNPDRCLPKAKAQSLTKGQRAATAAKKKKAGSKGKTVVKNTKKATVKKEGLWANINAKKKAGKKSSHKNSNAYKDAKKAGNALKKEGEGNERAIKGQELVDYIMGHWNWSEEKTLNWLANNFGKEKQDDGPKEEDQRYIDYLRRSGRDAEADKLVALNPDKVKETKEAPAGHYFTKSGNLVKGRMSADAKERGARKSDPKDNQRSKVPAVTQYKEDIRNLVVGLLHEIQNTNFKVLKKGPYYRYLPTDDLFTDLNQLGHHGLQRSPDNLVVIKTAEELLDILDDMHMEDPERAIAFSDQNNDIIKFLGTNETLMEKDDRCTRLAKQKYDTWPSAYASGAVVRCRRGEIWKKK